MRTATLLTLLFLGLSSASRAQELDTAKLDRFFDRLAEKDQAMGSLVVTRNGDVIYARTIGHGQINGTDRTPLTAASRFRIASITKMFTAVMILQLAEEGKLKLSDTLDRFFPEVPNAAKITLAHLLSHRSGIPNVRRERNTQVPVNTLPISRAEILALMVNAPADFEPGTQQKYSNSGFFLLGLIIEKATGTPYELALAERITSRIGLRDTTTATGAIDVRKNEALTYFHTGSEWKQGIETHPSILFGAGQIISTPHDLARFADALFGLKLISRESLAAMTTMRDGEGLGMETYTYADRTFYGHAGGGDNYGSWLAYQPEEKLAIAYTTNAKVHPVPEIIRAVADILYQRPFEIPAFATIAVGVDMLDRYVGTYSHPDAPIKFTITRNGPTLFVQPGGESPAALEATAENRFQLMRGRVVFEFDAARGQMTMKRGGGDRVFTKDAAP